jgi:hypothetical protein
MAAGIAVIAAPQIKTRDGKDELFVSPLDKLDRSPDLITFQSAVQSHLPNIDLPNNLLEVAARAKFAEAFTHISETNLKILLAVRHVKASQLTLHMFQALNLTSQPSMFPSQYPPFLQLDNIVSKHR